MYLINFTEHNKKFCLGLHCNGTNSYLFLNGKEIIKFKAKDSEIVATPLCSENISKDWTEDNMKNSELNGFMIIIIFMILVLIIAILLVTIY